MAFRKRSILLFLIFPSLWLLLNIVINAHIFYCIGPVIKPNSHYAERIKTARKLFTKNPKISQEPEYFIKAASCYNAWAPKNYTIIISEPVVRDFSIEELAGIMGHEFGHLESWQEKQHWKIDVRGAEFTSKDIQLKFLKRIVMELDKPIKKNKLLVYAFPLSLLHYHWLVKDFQFRIEQVNKFTK